jgi:hypothetical protein
VVHLQISLEERHDLQHLLVSLMGQGEGRCARVTRCQEGSNPIQLREVDSSIIFSSTETAIYG